MKLAVTIVKEAAAQAAEVLRGDSTDSIRKTAEIGYDAGSPAGQSDRMKLKAWAGAANPQLFSGHCVYVG